MPVVWTVEAYRAGERGQVQALVDALAWPNESKRLSYRQLAFMPHVLGLSTLHGLTPQSRELLQPPWPDLVISSGVRNEPVCRWIRQQSAGRTRYVHVGKPWAGPESFDAIVTTPQYRIVDRNNVVQNTLTLHSVTRSRLDDAAASWRDQFSTLPKPHIAVVVGGDSGPFTFGVKAARRLASEASALARKSGGSLLVTTSSRTRPVAVDALCDAIDAPNYFYAWRPNDEMNPYFGILGCADQCVVTADSIAMLSEACATGKPVAMYDLGGMQTGVAAARDFRLGGSIYQFLLRWCWRPLTRDITLVHRKLLAAGLVSWLGDLPLATAPAATPERANADMERAVRAVKNLFGELGVTAAVEQDSTAID
jgi:uncharacterized protein